MPVEIPVFGTRLTMFRRRCGLCDHMRPVNIWTTLGIFLMGAAAGALLTFIARSGNSQKLRAQIEKDRDSSNPIAQVNDLLTVLGAPQLHPTENRPLTTEERIEWIQANVG